MAFEHDQIELKFDFNSKLAFWIILAKWSEARE